VKNGQNSKKKICLTINIFVKNNLEKQASLARQQYTRNTNKDMMGNRGINTCRLIGE
jgi:hypothetical protein